MAAADSSWQELEPVIREAEDNGLADPGVYTQKAFTWAFSMLLSRLVRLPGKRIWCWESDSDVVLALCLTAGRFQCISHPFAG